MEQTLTDQWNRLVLPLGAPRAEAAAALADLDRRWGEPHRAYHTRAHLRHVLAVVDHLLDVGEPADDPAAVRLAVWFHDAVYDPRSGGNEEASAALAARCCTDLGVHARRVAAVRALVLATADHRADDDDGRVLCDADLAVLASDPTAYDLYRRGVRAEYGHLDEAAFRAGRAAVLRAFLDADTIYATATMRTQAEGAARRNLSAELAELTGTGG